MGIQKHPKNVIWRKSRFCKKVEKFTTLFDINFKIQDVLEMNNLQKIFIFLICPHHPHHGYPEEIEELKYICNCRKPNIGLFHILERNINVDKSKSLMIGDTISDKEFAKNCGIKFLFEQDI